MNSEMGHFCKYCNMEHPRTKEFWLFETVRMKCRKENKARCRDYYRRNRDKVLEQIRSKKRSERPDVKRYKSEYFQKNKSLVYEYRNKNRIKLRRQHNEYCRNRQKNDMQFAIAANLRKRLNIAVKKKEKKGSAVALLGCSILELKEYLGSKFQEGMSWENYGRTGWHIDHIIPLSLFDLTDQDQLKQACHYTNLQPLWASDNLSKKNKLL